MDEKGWGCARDSRLGLWEAAIGNRKEVPNGPAWAALAKPVQDIPVGASDVDCPTVAGLPSVGHKVRRKVHSRQARKCL